MLEPIERNNKIIVATSLTLGRLNNLILLLDNKVEAKIGRDEFFDPEIFIVPLSLFAPITCSFSIVYTFGKVTPSCPIYLPFLSE